MGVPRLAHYTIEELAKLWGFSVELIEKYTERGQLNYHSIWYNSYHDGTNMMPGDNHPDGPDENNHSAFWTLDSIVYKLEEVERFEKKHGIIPVHHPDKCPTPTPKESAAFVVPEDTEWYDIKIHFTSFEEVTVSVGKKKFERNYKSMGLENRVGKKTKKSWDLLFDLALTGGNPKGEYKNLKKLVSDLQKHLTHLFPGATGKPFKPFVKQIGWQPRISLTVQENIADRYR